MFLVDVFGHSFFSLVSGILRLSFLGLLDETLLRSCFGSTMLFVLSGLGYAFPLLI